MISPRRPDFWLASWGVALLVTALAVGLHVYFWQQAGGLWRDEVNLVNLAKLDSLRAMSRDSFPVLMPLVVRGWDWLGPGKSDAGLRLLGMLIGLGLPAALWLAAWKFHRSPPLVGVALLALNGTVIVFGDSLRAHGLGSLLILLTAVAACWFMAKPSRGRATVWTLLAVASVQTLFHNSIFIAAICAGTWAVCIRRKDLRAALKVLLVGLVAAASLLPYVSNFIALNNSAGSLRTGVEPGRLRAMFDTAFGFPMDQCRWLWIILTITLVIAGIIAAGLRFKSTGNLTTAPKFLTSRLTMPVVAAVAAAGFLWFAPSPGTRWWIFVLLALATIWLDRQLFSPREPAPHVPAQDISGDLSLFGGVTLLLAFAGFAGFLWYAALPTEQWYFIPLLALAAGCFELGLPVRGHVRAAVFGFSAMLLAAASLVIFSDQRVVNWRFTNVDLLSKQLEANIQPGDFVMVNPWYCGITFGRYCPDTIEWETIPPVSDHTLARYDLIHAQMQKPHAIQPLLERAEVALRAGHRVWLVGVMDEFKPGGTAPADLPPPPLEHSGWSDRPYTHNWILQVNQFLSNHGREFSLVYETPAGHLNFMENLQLHRIEGWHD